MTLQELLAHINAYVGENPDRKRVREVANELRKNADGAAATLVQDLLNIGAGRKAGETKGTVEQLNARIQELETERDEAQQALSELQAKQPDVATAVEAERKKWEAKLADAKKAATEAADALAAERQSLAVERFVSHLVAMNVDEDYARTVAAAKYRDRLPVDDKTRTVRVLQLEGAEPYDVEGEGAAALDAATRKLAEDVKAKVPDRYITTGAGAGGPGVGGATDTLTTGPAAGGGYDPVAVGKQMAQQQKAQTQRASLAFK